MSLQIQAKQVLETKFLLGLTGELRNAYRECNPNLISNNTCLGMEINVCKSRKHMLKRKNQGHEENKCKTGKITSISLTV